MKKMLVLAMTMAMVLLAAAGVCETLRVGMECNYAPYNLDAERRERKRRGDRGGRLCGWFRCAHREDHRG